MTRFFNSLLLSILLLPVLAFGQDVSVRGMKGLNTIKNPLSVGPDEATFSFNWDYREIGSIAPRKGYDSISAVTGMDSIVNIYAFYESDGEQRIVVVADSTGVGYGGVYLTNPGSVNLSGDSLTQLTNLWATGQPTYFTAYNNNLYMVNGQHKGLWWNGDVARDWPIRAPGEPKIIPISDGNELDGEYVYRISAKWGKGAIVGNGDGIISTRVKVNSGRVLLAGFDAICSDTSGSAIDSLIIVVHRTHANPGPLEPGDSAQRVYQDTIAQADLPTWSFIDSIADAGYNDVLWRDTNYGIDSTGTIIYRYGAPQYDTTMINVSYTAAGDANGNVGVYYGIPDQNDTLGVVYVCTFIDTASGNESDTGRSAWLFNDTSEFAGAAKPQGWWVKLPKTHGGETGVRINLYRAMILEMIWGDSTLKEDIEWVREGSGFDQFKQVKTWKYVPIGDSIYRSEFRLVGQYSASDTLVFDQLRWDDLQDSKPFTKAVPPSLMTNLLTHDNRLWGIQGSKVWYSEDLRVDTLQSWGQLSFTSLDESDGDVLTSLFVSRGVVRAMKNNSTYNLYETEGGTWTGDEIAGNFGVVSPQSVEQGITGTYYLSNAGVILETEGLYRERQIQTGLISEVLDNFDKLSISNKRSAIGFKFDREHKYFLSVPAVDTTYVWDERAGQWSTWDLVFSDAILYGTESSVDFIPGDTMYFIRPGDSILYKYGTRSTDNGSQIDLVWKGGPFGVSKDLQTVEAVGFWTRSDSAKDSIAYFVRNDQDASTGSIIVDSLNLRFRGTQEQSNPGLFHSIDILTNTSKVRGDIYIDGYDVWVRKHGDYQWR